MALSTKVATVLGPYNIPVPSSCHSIVTAVSIVSMVSWIPGAATCEMGSLALTRRLLSHRNMAPPIVLGSPGHRPYSWTKAAQKSCPIMPYP